MIDDLEVEGGPSLAQVVEVRASPDVASLVALLLLEMREAMLDGDSLSQALSARLRLRELQESQLSNLVL